MPVKWFLAPDGRAISFEEAPGFFENAGLMPSYAVEAVLRELASDRPAFNVRPSDVTPTMTCRRQRVWMATHDYGVDPLAIETMMEGTGFHQVLRTQEIQVPERHHTRGIDADGNQIVTDERLPVCGVPMRGIVDFIVDDRIEDVKTTAPFWASKYAPKGSADRWPITYIWEKEDRDKDDVAKWQLQLSIYGVLLEKSGHRPVPKTGRIQRRYGGVKPKHGRWKKFDFPLLSEAELEERVGPWIRSLAAWLELAKTDPEGAWKAAEPDGRQFIGSEGMWACDRCPLKEACFKQDELVVF